jgi:hypothetical protein
VTDFKTIIEPILDMVTRKNADYGDSYNRLRAELGEVAFYVRAWDKIFRLQAVDKAQPQTNETAEDTLKDIIGYCLLELRYRQAQARKGARADA